MIAALRYMLVGSTTTLLVLLPGGYLDQLGAYVSQSVPYLQATQPAASNEQRLWLPDGAGARLGAESAPRGRNVDCATAPTDGCSDMQSSGGSMDSMDSMGSIGSM